MDFQERGDRIHWIELLKGNYGTERVKLGCEGGIG